MPHAQVDEHGITAGSFRLLKPFVEKPANGDDHDVYIYFAPADGGGAQHLFRKTDDCCSVFLPELNTLRKGSFIYEQFVPTDGFDVKVYTVGHDYFHAEGRKVRPSRAAPFLLVPRLQLTATFAGTGGRWPRAAGRRRQGAAVSHFLDAGREAHRAAGHRRLSPKRLRP